MSRTIHMCMSIKGFIKNTKYPQGYKDVFNDEDGNPLTPHDAREYLFNCLAEGKLVLPFGECEGFDYKTGCPGHEHE